MNEIKWADVLRNVRRESILPFGVAWNSKITFCEVIPLALISLVRTGIVSMISLILSIIHNYFLFAFPKRHRVIVLSVWLKLRIKKGASPLTWDRHFPLDIVLLTIIFSEHELHFNFSINFMFSINSSYWRAVPLL